MFSGILTAIVTPFLHGRIDEEAFRKLISWQIAQGIHGIVVCGTTGESATVTETEYRQLLSIAFDEAHGRIPIIAGTGSNNTAHAVKLARIAKEVGVAAHLNVTPYYNKPTQEGLFQHFRAIASSVDLPLLLYNVPGRTAVNLLPETVQRLCSSENIIGVKEASGDMAQIKKIMEMVPSSFCIYSGDDDMNLDIYQLGGKGAISVASNVAPQLVAKVWNEYVAGRIDHAKQIQQKLAELNDVLFIESNPIPVKTALAIMGSIQEEFRLPLTPMSEDHKGTLRQTLRTLQLLS